MRGLYLLVLLTGCVSADRSARADDAVARELAGRVAGEVRSCIPTSPNQGLTVLDRRTLSYRSGRTVWINRLERDCPGMDQLSTLVIETRGSQYCRSDPVRTVHAGASIPGPVCLLGDFTAYRLPQ